MGRKSELSEADDNTMKTRITLLMAVIILGSLLAGCASASQQIGTLDLRVSIGPGATAGDTPGGLPSYYYEPRKIRVLNEDGTKLIKSFKLGDMGLLTPTAGYYENVLHLNQGIYIVEAVLVHEDTSLDVPKVVEVRPGETVTVNVAIDMGQPQKHRASGDSLSPVVEPRTSPVDY